MVRSPFSAPGAPFAPAEETYVSLHYLLEKHGIQYNPQIPGIRPLWHPSGMRSLFHRKSGGIAALNPRIGAPKLFMACGRSGSVQAQAQRAVNNFGARLSFGRSPDEFSPHSFEEF